MPRIEIDRRAVPLALLALCLLSFAPLVGLLGFYWDDWPTIWYLHNFGPASFREGFASDRPLLAYFFMLTTSLVGENALGWQVLGILTRWLCVWLFWWLLRLIWPDRLLPVTLMAMAFALYPGFRQQYISVTYSNGFLVYALYLLSLVTMLLALRQRRWYWPLMLASLALAVLSLFISEYFFGLELLRPVLLWFLQSGRNLPRAKLFRRVALQWLPFLAGMAAFLVWRLFLYPTPRGSVTLFDLLRERPWIGSLEVVWTVASDLFEVAGLAWVDAILLPRLLNFPFQYILAYILVGLLSGALAFMFLMRLESGVDPAPPPGSPGIGDRDPVKGLQKLRARFAAKSPAWKMVLFGFYALLIAGWPVWVTDLHFELVFPWDRFTLMMMPGAAILVGGLVSAVAGSRRQVAAVAALLVGLAAGMHLHDAVVYRQEWLALKAFFWQLSWRAPGLQAGTAVLTADLPFNFYSDNSLSAPLNWMYSPDDESLKMPYLVYDVESRLGRGLPSLDPGLPIELPYRVTSFEGTTSQAVLVFFSPPRCLKVMDPEADRNLPYKPLYIPQTLPLSRPELILADHTPVSTPPQSIFGAEPEPHWCYYFEKAELASQEGDWEAVVALADSAFKIDKQFDRETASELIPFIKGFAHTGGWDRAVELSLLAMQASPKMQNMLCQTWYRMREGAPPGLQREAAYQAISEKVPCDFP